jgi:DNA polymerase-4
METGWARASRPVRLLGVGVRLGDTETVEQLRLFDDAMPGPGAGLIDDSTTE